LQAQIITPQEARVALMRHTGLDFVTKETVERAHALEILAAIKSGDEVEIFASDNIPIFIEVFTEFMRTDEYYDLDTAVQDYMSDVLVAMSTAGAPAADYEKALLNFKVFPRTEPERDEAIDAVALQRSPAAAAQTGAQALDIATAVEQVDIVKNPRERVAMEDDSGVLMETEAMRNAGGQQ